ncbi:MAG TPA: glycosyltransferase family 2 protein [Acidimicrobiia bacterium]
MSLSAAIIVKDEADRLDACLTSLRGLVDEIVVVDTGSTDHTVAIAEAHGAVVAHEPWQGDFAAPRNRSLDLATGDWVLYVDADEQIQGDFDDARAYLDRASACVGLRVRFVPRVGWTPFREYRLWRNRPDIRFQGHIHETVVPSIRAAADAYALHIEPFDRLTIHHYGYEGDRADKRARDEPLLIAELARHPDRPFVYDHLARVYEAAGDGERAVDTWKEGITRVRERDRLLPEDRVLYVDLIHHLLANGVIDDELEVLVDEARDQFVRTPTLELAAARLAFATGRPRDALEPLDWLVSLDDDGIIATGASYDERVFGEWAWSLLGLCRFALGDDAAAADAFGRAEQLAPGDASYGVRRRLAEARAATPAS